MSNEEKKKDDKKKEINLKDVIKKTAKETAQEVIQELKSNRYIKGDISYYRKVELLLYNYQSLKSAVEQKDQDIAYIEKHGLPERSKSIVFFQSSGGNMSGQDRYMQMIEKYQFDKLETEREISRIENALDKIRDDKYFDIIQYKYLSEEKKRLTDEQLSERFEKDQSTITRNKKRLINSIKVILFPESIKDFA